MEHKGWIRLCHIIAMELWHDPNKGANYLGPFLGIVYEPEKETTKIAKGEHTS